MVLDVLIELGVPVTYARTRVIPSLLSPRERAGKLLGVRSTEAVLEMEELIFAGRDERVAYSRDLFAPGGIDVMVLALARADPSGAGRHPPHRPRPPQVTVHTGRSRLRAQAGDGGRDALAHAASRVALACAARVRLGWHPRVCV